MMQKKTAAFLALAITCTLAIIASITFAHRRFNTQGGDTTPSATKSVQTENLVSQIPDRAATDTLPSDRTPRRHAHEDIGALGKQAHPGQTSNLIEAKVRTSSAALLYFRANTLGENYGKLAVAGIDALNRVTYSAQLKCERVHFSGGTGVCLASDLGFFSSYYAIKFDDQMRPGWRITLNGAPSRVRVSPSGRLAAITVFLPGSSHSYAAGTLSTQTTMVDVTTGKVLADLEQFAVTRNGQQFKSPDFNFWGVTFTKNETVFYATLWTQGNTFLVEADLTKRTARVIHDGVECPSLSPDSRRIAFKKRVTGSPYSWRITLLDLQSGQETALGESRNVDDQVEWLDNDHVLYALSQGDATHSSASTNIWMLPTTTGATATVMVQGGASPAVVHSSESGTSKPSVSASRSKTPN